MIFSRSFHVCFLVVFLSAGLLGQAKFKVGIVPFKSDEKVRNTFNPIMDYIASELGKKAEVNLVDAPNLAYYLEKGKYDVGIFTVFPYLKEKHDFPDLEVFATHQIKGSDHFYGSILCNKDAGINSLQELKDKTFMFVKPTSTSGFKYPKGILTEYDMDIDEALSYDFSGGHEEAILALANKECDAIAVDETRFEKIDSFSKDDFKELKRYIVPYHAYIISPKVSEVDRAEIIEAFKNAHKNPYQKALWENPLGIEKFLLKKDDYYNPIRRYLSIVRVKPTLDIHVSSTENAKKYLTDLGDISSIIDQRIRRKLAESQRFSNKPSENPTYDVHIKLSHLGKNFTYQIEVNNELLTDGDVVDDSLGITIPEIASGALLTHCKIETPLLTNGEKWFITYGLKDGLNSEDYTFEFLTPDKEKVVLTGNDIASINESSIQFKEEANFVHNTKMTIHFIEEAHAIPVIKKGRNYNIFSRTFWRQSFLDKLLALLGTFFGIAFAIYTTLYTRKKKKKFKAILYDTNNLLKKFIDGQIEMETKVIQQKEDIRVSLERGIITENQYLILNHRLEELEQIFEQRQRMKGDIAITEMEAEEISEIVQDGKVTEKEFSRILNILRTNNKA